MRGLTDSGEWKPVMIDDDGGQRVKVYGSIKALGSDGVTAEEWRNNTEGTLLASAARTANTNSPVVTNYNARGVILALEIAANPANAETLTLQCFPSPNGKYWAYNAAFEIPAGVDGVYQLLIYPGALSAPENTNFFKHYSWPVPRQFWARVVHSGSSSWTYALHYSLIV